MSTWRWSSREDSTEVRRRFTASKSHFLGVTLESSPTVVVVVVVVVVSLVFFSASIFCPVAEYSATVFAQYIFISSF